MTSVGVVGLGQIGSGLAGAVSGAGLTLAVHDVRPAAMEPFADRAQLCGDVPGAASAADVLLVAVVDDDQVRQVLTGPDGALEAMRPGAVVAVVSTISLATLADVADVAAGRGVGLIDCGVTGGPAAAAAGQLVSMVGGSDADVEAARPALEAFSSLVLRMGPLGAGMKAKLARQVAQFGAWLAAFEGARLAEAGGADLGALAQAIRAGDALTGGPTALMFRSTTAPWAETDDAGLVEAMRVAAGLARKDLDAAGRLAADLGLDTPFLRLLGSSIDAVFGFGS